MLFARGQKRLAAPAQAQGNADPMRLLRPKVAAAPHAAATRGRPPTPRALCNPTGAPDPRTDAPYENHHAGDEADKRRCEVIDHDHDPKGLRKPPDPWECFTEEGVGVKPPRTLKAFLGSVKAAPPLPKASLYRARTAASARTDHTEPVFEQLGLGGRTTTHAVPPAEPPPGCELRRAVPVQEEKEEEKKKKKEQWEEEGEDGGKEREEDEEMEIFCSTACEEKQYLVRRPEQNFAGRAEPRRAMASARLGSPCEKLWPTLGGTIPWDGNLLFDDMRERVGGAGRATGGAREGRGGGGRLRRGR